MIDLTHFNILELVLLTFGGSFVWMAFWLYAVGVAIFVRWEVKKPTQRLGRWLVILVWPLSPAMRYALRVTLGGRL